MNLQSTLILLRVISQQYLLMISLIIVIYVLKNDLKVTDILDIRPRVRPFDPDSTSTSPFEFESRSFQDGTNSAKNILASDESITLIIYFLSSKN